MDQVFYDHADGQYERKCLSLSHVRNFAVLLRYTSDITNFRKTKQGPTKRVEKVLYQNRRILSSHCS
jgi:hypothetical protein